MIVKKLKIIFILTTLLSFETKATSCVDWRELDLYEYISADLIAEIKIINYESSAVTQSTSCVAKIITKYRGSKNLGKQVTIKSINGLGTYTPKSGTMLIWAYKQPDGTYSTNSCTRSFHVSSETDFLNSTVNTIKSKWKNREQLKFLRRYKNRTCKIDVFQDSMYIRGALKKGWPVGLWEITSANKETVTRIKFEGGEKHGEKIVMNTITGMIKYASFYKFNLKNGKEYRMYQNGQIKSIQTFLNGMLTGKEIRYFENGNVNYVGINKNTNPDGIWKYYNENGFLRKEIIYKRRGKIENLTEYKEIYESIEHINYDKNGELIKRYVQNFDTK